MADTLPNEITKEILVLAIQPDAAFEAFIDLKTDLPPTLVKPLSYLLVSRSWLQIATPLIYETIVLKSQRQAVGLAVSLKLTPELGLCIKHLRINGGFGSAAKKILASSPNVKSIGLTITIASTDSTSGLFAGLCLINPTRLIFYPKRRPRSGHPGTRILLNKNEQVVLDGVIECVAHKWKQLVSSCTQLSS
jgi:hypothetical protein